MPGQGLPFGSRLLLVGTDPIWRATAEQAAARLGVPIDFQPDMPGALALMLDPHPDNTHVLASGKLDSASIDALAGMLDEVTRQPTPVLLLGNDFGHGNKVHALLDPSVEALIQSLAELQPAPPADHERMNAAELVGALYGGMLRMRFQPVVSADDLRPQGLEALARLHHPSQGILHPKAFMALAMGSGHARLLTGIAASRTLFDLRALPRSPPLYVAINAPLQTIFHEDGLARAMELVAAAETDPSTVVMEVLETEASPDFAELGRALERWRRAGFRLAIDDAGPALPHWRQMLDLPFDSLKLDGRLAAEPEQLALAAHIVDSARRRGLYVIAEGVEDEAACQRMRGLGVDAMQGFLFSRPLPAMAVPIWVAQWEQQRSRAARADSLSAADD